MTCSVSIMIKLEGEQLKMSNTFGMKLTRVYHVGNVWTYNIKQMDMFKNFTAKMTLSVLQLILA